MGSFVDGPVRVSVPATSANLGPGFDSLGLALDLRDELTGEVADSGLDIEVRGVCADEVPRDGSHLVVRAMRAAFDAMAVRPAGLRLSCDNANIEVPQIDPSGNDLATIVDQERGVQSNMGLERIVRTYERVQIGSLQTVPDGGRPPRFVGARPDHHAGIVET